MPMDLLELTLPTPAENLALDEALLERVDSEGTAADLLRLWESPQTAVVVGRGSRVGEEVNVAFCETHGIPILRRCSGGAAVVIGAGCLMYSVVLRIQDRPGWRTVDQSHQLVLQPIRNALRELGVPAEMSGTSDLTLHGRKFSGNSLRCHRHALLYHGTLLYEMPFELIADCLRMPPRRPAYRADREHSDFLVHLPVDVARLREALICAWACEHTCEGWPEERTLELVAHRYSCAEWNWQR